MEVSSLTAELPGNEVSFHRVPLIQRARSSPPRPKVVLAGQSSLQHAGVVCCYWDKGLVRPGIGRKRIKRRASKEIEIISSLLQVLNQWVKLKDGNFSFKRVKIRGLNLGKNTRICCKMMSKNVQCGQITTKSGKGRDLEYIKFSNGFEGL